MALVQWKQIETDLKQDGILTGSLSISGSLSVIGDKIITGDQIVSGNLFLNGLDVEELLIFRQTGSFWNTTRNVGITGSFNVNLLSEDQDTLEISVDEEPRVEINKQGVLKLHPLNETPDPVDGGIFYSGSEEFFLGT